ncbi:MAG: cell division protein FtsQ [Acidobacteriota bacterium]|jgi:cell division septal protein FtsQ|nr:cell division protein FtsQ [Acidobacteriota bacterium]
MLKEQVITPRGGRGAGRGGGGDVIVVTTEGRAGKIVQRPSARRGGKAQDKRAGQQRVKSKRGAWREIVAWAPTVGKVLVAVCAGLILFKGYRAAAASTFFELRSLDVSGVSQASDDQIKQIVRRETAATGVWKADLAAISTQLERQPWVRKAVVTRVLPSGLRVRITERVPRVVVRNAAGHFVWVDDDGVEVGSLTPTQQQPAFFMRGWDESNTDAARTENRERVKTFMNLTGEWESAGLAARVSELNLDDLRDVRAQLAGDDSQIEVRLGKEDWTKRLRQALETLDAQRTSPRAALFTYVDMTQGKRAVVGFNPHAQAAGANVAGNAGATGAGDGGATAVSAETSSAHDDAARVKVEARAAKAKSKAEKSSRDKRRGGGERSARQARNGAERPRRVTKGV